ncbi:MAG: UbiH/UbiF family hydroxylase [Hyphomicrobiales bacterium]|nr:UbiH/UbiF family hydroxylase [Hyphomicrobiales bacterium]
MTQTAEVVVVGGGPAGLTAAVALAMAGIETALVARPTQAADNRTTALLAGSVTALTTLDVWQHCRRDAAPLRVMRLVDDTTRLLRAPEVAFAAAEIGLDAFGYNIENRHLLAALDARARALPQLLRLEDEAGRIEINDDDVTVHCRGAAITARLLVAADGRRSLCRAAAGIEVRSRDYPQTALTCNLAHARAHHDTSTELHTEQGPFTLVPLPGRRSSLVYVVAPAALRALTELDERRLSAHLERRSHSILGKISVEPGRGFFPLTVETATCFGARRVALVGEAAHVIPPIGAQGLNLGLRDGAIIGELVVEARRRDSDVGEVTARYERMRRADVESRTLAVDLLNRSLLSDFLPLQGARGLGLFLLQQIGPLRRAMMREGVMPMAAQPRLMRGLAL